MLRGIILIFSICSCDGYHDWRDDVNQREDYRQADKTTLGIHVEFSDQGTLSQGWKTKGEIYRIFDKAFLRAADLMHSQYGYPKDQFAQKLHDKKMYFILVDHFHYWSEVNSRLVEGEWYIGKHIRVCLWSEGIPLSSTSSIPSTSPSWTWTWEPQTHRWRYGILDEIKLANLIKHEMGHFLYEDPSFEH
jgi:hypothetical protein